MTIRCDTSKYTPIRGDTRSTDGSTPSTTSSATIPRTNAPPAAPSARRQSPPARRVPTPPISISTSPRPPSIYSTATAPLPLLLATPPAKKASPRRHALEAVMSRRHRCQLHAPSSTHLRMPQRLFLPHRRNRRSSAAPTMTPTTPTPLPRPSALRHHASACPRP